MGGWFGCSPSFNASGAAAHRWPAMLERCSCCCSRRCRWQFPPLPAFLSYCRHAFRPPPTFRCSFNRSMGHSNYHLQSPVPACHFWADHRYRILYVRNFKTAGTSITVTLGQKELHMYCK